MGRWYTKLALCLLPLALVPLVFFSLAEGWISLAGGEKDIILAFPYAVWAIIYTIGYAVMWVRRSDERRCAGYAALFATLPLGVGGVILLVWSSFQTPG